jgi:hypothetical protein
MNPKIGYIFFRTISQCSGNKYKGKIPVIFSLPVPTASYPSDALENPP